MMSPFSHPSSELSHHPHTIGESLSEAFLDSSSARDALPKQYQAKFDELREGILTFCHDFEIPNEALRSTEVFGAVLKSTKIPQERMLKAVLLFERLEHLVTHREPLKEELPEHLEKVEHLYHLREQYDAQFNLLKEAGIFNERNAIVGIDGKEYSIPTLEQIAERLFERERELSTKRDQGFIKLLLVPFGMSLDAFAETFKQFLRDYKQSHPDFHLRTKTPLETSVGVYEGADVGDPPKIFYNPKFFDEDHQGQTKFQILEEQVTDPFSFQGWRVLLLQPSDPADSHFQGIASIPRQGQGKTQGKKIPRSDLEAGQTPDDYLSILQEAHDRQDSPYFQESGITIEDWMIAFMTHLKETGQLLDENENKIYGVCCMIGSFLSFLHKREDKDFRITQALWVSHLREVVLSVLLPYGKGGSIGTRFSVVI